ncbi:caspase family protein [Streptomyces roseirectus]|uniref:Caspase family protein n=1 Tax=Streptomyces roseirectus TaxID=2768066 RepID=A0A7H0I608_9ACTN|nr:caspase family protein [Streptomyces roseirectus]QNP68224.1 caspase family protein [Streptomyces roseirectus]
MRSPTRSTDPTDGRRRFLFAVGVEEYEHLSKLPSVPDDLKSVRELFGGLGSEPAVSDGLDVTRARLLGQLEGWLKDGTRTSEDVLVLYFSGHGTSAEDGRHYLCTRETDPGRFLTTAVPTEDLARLIVASPVTTAMVVLDACYGEHGADDSLLAVLRAAGSAAVGTSTDGLSGLWLISASRRVEEADEGAFTAALGAALGDEALGGPRQRYLFSEALVEAVNARLAAAGHAQRARLHVVGVGGPCPALPNPRYVPGLPNELTVEEQRRFVADPEHWMAKARGGAERGDGWYFTGRDAATAAVVGHLTAAEVPRGFVFVTGGPGSGKSALLGRIVTLSDPLMRRSTSARFRAEAGMLPVGVVDVAVHARGKTLPDVVAEMAEAVGTQMTDAAALLSVLRERRERLTVVVDALDEAAEPSEITGGLLIQLAVLGGRSDVRLVVGGRPHLRSLFGESVPRTDVDLDSDSYFSGDDVADYVEQYVRAEPGSPYRADPVAAAEAARAVAVRADRTFLIAYVYARLFAASATPVDVTGDEWARPGQLHDVLRADIERLGPDTERARDLLRPLAYAEGAGLPWEGLWAPLASAVSGRTYTDDDIRWLLSAGGSYVIEALEAGRSVYRLYHQAFADYLRLGRDAVADQRAIADCLRALVPASGPEEGAEWSAAHPYVLRNLAAHAARGGRLDGVMVEPGFLACADHVRIASVLHLVRSKRGWETVHAFQQVEARMAAAPVPDRLSYLQMAARQRGMDWLNGAVERVPVDRPWTVPWTQWETSYPSRELGRLGAPAAAVGVVPVDGRPVVVACDLLGRVRRWDLATGEELPGPRPSSTVPHRAVALLVRGATAWMVALRGRHWLSVCSVTDPDDVRMVRVPGPANKVIEATAAAVREGTPVAVVSYGDEIRVCSLETGVQVIGPLRTGRRLTSVSVAEVKGRQTILASGPAGTVDAWDLADGNPVRLFGPGLHFENPWRPETFALTAGPYRDGTVVVRGSSDDRIDILDGGSGKSLARIGPIRLCRAFMVVHATEDSSMLLVADSEGAVRAWDLGVLIGFAADRPRARALVQRYRAAIRLRPRALAQRYRAAVPLSAPDDLMAVTTAGGEPYVFTARAWTSGVWLRDARTGSVLGGWPFTFPLTGAAPRVQHLHATEWGGRPAVVVGDRWGEGYVWRAGSRRVYRFAGEPHQLLADTGAPGSEPVVLDRLTRAWELDGRRMYRVDDGFTVWGRVPAEGRGSRVVTRLADGAGRMGVVLVGDAFLDRAYGEYAWSDRIVWGTWQGRRIVVVVAVNGSVGVWDPGTGDLLWSWAADREAPSRVDVAVGRWDGRLYVIVALTDGVVRIFDLDRDRCTDVDTGSDSLVLGFLPSHGLLWVKARAGLMAIRLL